MNRVQHALIASPVPLSVSMLMEKTSLDFEQVYTELVALEGCGRAAPVLGFYPRRPHIPEAGWIATERKAAND